MKQYIIFFIGILMFTSFACRKDDDSGEITEDIIEEEEETIDLETYTDWTTETHSDTAETNYDIVFNQEEVLRFDIEISSSDWSIMQSDLSSNLGSSGGRPGNLDSDYDPIWVPCSFNFNDTEWYHVGIRYKGNSSLQSAYTSGNNKLSFKLDFDEFEEDYEGLKNQRFYGFKQLNLNNNFDDASLVREKIGADLFRDFGLVSAKTSFCIVYIDHGTGPQYYGVYTIVEEVDDSVLSDQLGEESGNLYKPDGDAAAFANNSYDEGEMEKKNNEDLADYSDVRALYEIINSSDRSSNYEAWKTNLESVFNVDGFLKWLAANTVIQNWDTYGNMTHNYYLYNYSGQLNWIPWDNNEAFQAGKQSGALSLSLSEVSSSWPLINYLIADSEYQQLYEGYLQQFIDEVFIPADMISTYTKYYNLLKEYAYAEQSGYTYIYSDSNFDQAISTLKTHVQSRNDAVNNYLQ